MAPAARGAAPPFPAQNTATLTLTGVSAGDAGNYQLVATASGTGYTLNSATAAVVLPDPQITANPANATANYGQTVTFTATATTANAPLHYGWYSMATPLQQWDCKPGGRPWPSTPPEPPPAVPHLLSP